MQIILLDKIANLGSLGDVVKVKDGYARNYLIPQGKAKRATLDAITEFESRRAELEKQQSDRQSAAQAVAEKMDGLVIGMQRKAGIDGHLFGSVTAHDVYDALQAQGFNIDKNSVHMPDGVIKMLGEFELQVAVHADVTARITVQVEAE